MITNSFTKLLSTIYDESRETVPEKEERTRWSEELENIKLSIKLLRKEMNKYLRKSERATLHENKNKFNVIFHTYKQTLNFCNSKI